MFARILHVKFQIKFLIMKRLPHNVKKQFLFIFINLQPLELPTRSKKPENAHLRKMLKNWSFENTISH